MMYGYLIALREEEKTKRSARIYSTDVQNTLCKRVNEKMGKPQTKSARIEELERAVIAFSNSNIRLRRELDAAVELHDRAATRIESALGDDAYEHNNWLFEGFAEDIENLRECKKSLEGVLTSLSGDLSYDKIADTKNKIRTLLKNVG